MAYDPLGGQAIAAIIVEAADLVGGGGEYSLQRGPYLVLYFPEGSPGGGATALADLTDVNLTGLANEDVLRYTGTQWINTNLGSLAILHFDFVGDDGMMRKTGAGSYEVVKVNFSATVDPTVNDDSGDDYAIGSRWLNVTDDKEFVCLDASVGAAVWVETTGGGTGTDELAAVSANDTTPDYLLAKLVEGSNITITETNDGGNETLVIAATGSLTNDIIQEGDSSVEVIDAGSGIINISIDADPVAIFSADGVDFNTYAISNVALKDYREVVSINAGVTTTFTFDLGDGNNFVLNLVGDTTLTFPAGLASGDGFSFTLEVVQDGTGGHDLTWPASVKWPGGVAPTQTTSPNARDLYQFYTRDGGTTWLGAQTGAGYA